MAFGASGGFGALAGWDLQSVGNSTSSERAVAQSKTGNEADSELYDKRTNVTATYKANKNYAATAPTIPANIGAVLNSVLLTSIAVSTSPTDFATMTLGGHAHVDGTDGTGLRSVAHNMALTKGFGANAFGITGGDSIMDGSVTITCDHAETKDANGDTAAGENYNARIELRAKVLGSGAILPANFDETERSVDTENTGFTSESVSAVKPLVLAE